MTDTPTPAVVVHTDDLADTIRSGQEILHFNGEEYGIRVLRHEDLTATIAWTDYLTGGWAETYPSLALALMRYACIDKCERANWDYSFGLDAEQHAASAQAWLDQAVG